MRYILKSRKYLIRVGIFKAKNEEITTNFAKFCGAKHCLGVANGLDALNLIICAYGFGVGDKIIVPANTYIAYPTPPHKQGAYKEWSNLSFPITEEIHNTIISLPISPVMIA